MSTMFLDMFYGFMRERNYNRFLAYSNQLLHCNFELLNMFQHFSAQYDVK